MWLANQTQAALLGIQPGGICYGPMTTFLDHVHSISHRKNPTPTSWCGSAVAQAVTQVR